MDNMKTKLLKKNIPIGWTEKKLGAVLRVGSGKDYKHLGSGDVPVFGTGGLMLTVDKALYEGETVFIGRKGTIDKPFYYKGKFWTVDTLFYTYDYKDTSARFINYVFQKINWILYNEASGVPSLSKTTIERIDFMFPSKPEQDRIVAVLELWDQVIEKLKRKIEIKKEIKKGLMQKLLTGKTRILDFDEDWRMVTLGSVAKMGSGGTPKSTNETFYGGNIPWVSIADMTANGQYVYSTFKNLSKEGLTNSAAKIYPKGTILYAMYASIGECSIAGVEMTSSQAILGIIPDEERLDSIFLYYYLKFIKERIKLQGQHGTQANLNAGMVREFTLNLPTVKEQKEIVKVIEAADQEISQLQLKLLIIKDQKKYLLDNLISGTIRTPETLSIPK